MLEWRFATTSDFEMHKRSNRADCIKGEKQCKNQNESGLVQVCGRFHSVHFKVPQRTPFWCFGATYLPCKWLGGRWPQSTPQRLLTCLLKWQRYASRDPAPALSPQLFLRKFAKRLCKMETVVWKSFARRLTKQAQILLSMHASFVPCFVYLEQFG